MFTMNIITYNIEATVAGISEQLSSENIPKCCIFPGDVWLLQSDYAHQHLIFGTIGGLTFG